MFSNAEFADNTQYFIDFINSHDGCTCYGLTKTGSLYCSGQFAQELADDSYVHGLEYVYLPPNLKAIRNWLILKKD